MGCRCDAPVLNISYLTSNVHRGNILVNKFIIQAHSLNNEQENLWTDHDGKEVIVLFQSEASTLITNITSLEEVHVSSEQGLTL